MNSPSFGQSVVHDTERKPREKNGRANFWCEEARQSLSLVPRNSRGHFFAQFPFCTHDGLIERRTTRSLASYVICFFSDFGKSVDVSLKGQPQADISYGSDKIIRVDSTTEANEGE